MDDHSVNETGAAQKAAPVSLYTTLAYAAVLVAAIATIAALANSAINHVATHTTAETPDTRPNMLYTCDDFTSQDEAQHWFDQWNEQYPELRRLDGDNNGIPCQNLTTLDDIPAVAQRANLLERLR